MENIIVYKGKEEEEEEEKEPTKEPGNHQGDEVFYVAFFFLLPSRTKGFCNSNDTRTYYIGSEWL